MKNSKDFRIVYEKYVKEFHITTETEEELEEL